MLKKKKKSLKNNHLSLYIVLMWFLSKIMLTIYGVRNNTWATEALQDMDN